jgi:hypothetical protein
MRRKIIFVSLLTVLLLAVPVLANADSDKLVEPDLVGTLKPCCGNDEAVPAKGKVLDRRPLGEHSRLPSEEVEAAKTKALFDRDAPSAIDLSEARETSDKSGAKVLRGKAPTIRASFDGMNIVQSGHQGVIGFPPDTIVAASPTRVLEASNVALRLTQRSGAQIARRSLNDFFSVKFPPLLFDPKVYYDRLSNRFFVLAISVDFKARVSKIHLSVSRGPNPSGLAVDRDFCTYQIPSTVGDSWADFPGLGMNEKWVSIGVNNFNFEGGFRSSFVYALDKAKLVQNGAGCPTTDFYRYKAAQDGHGKTAFTVQPAQHYSTNQLSGTPLFLLSSESTNGSSVRYTLWRLVENPAGGAKPLLGRFGLSGEQAFTVPPDAPQRGGQDLNTGEQSVLQVAYRDGELWAAHTTGCNFGNLPGESCIKVLRITPSADGGQIDFEEIVGGGDGWFFWMPGIAVNGRGDVLIVYQRSHASMSAGIGFAGRLAGGPFEAGKLINGRCPLDNNDGSRNRTGDYVGAQTDPADNLGFWIAGEYTGNVGNLGCDWRTRVGLVRF